MLKDLSVSALNGRVGMIVSDEEFFKAKGRHSIQLDGPYKSPSTQKLCNDPISIKPGNLEPLTGASQTCNGCLMKFSDCELIKCSKCRMVRYCSEDCQKDHWKREHSEDCKLLSTARKSASNSGHADSSSNKYDDEIMSMSPGDRIWAIHQRGLRHLQKGDPKSAEADFRHLIEKERWQVLGNYSNLGTCLLMQNKPQEAIPYLEKAVTLRPLEGRDELKIAYEMLSNAYGMSGNIPKYKTTLESGLKEFPGDQQFLAMMQRFDK